MKRLYLLTVTADDGANTYTTVIEGDTDEEVTAQAVVDAQDESRWSFGDRGYDETFTLQRLGQRWSSGKINKPFSALTTWAEPHEIHRYERKSAGVKAVEVAL